MSKNSKAKVLCLTLVLQLFAVVAFAQNLTVKGRVTDDKGAPVVGASVTVKGTADGTSTDGAGDYTISAARGATLVVSSVNFESIEVKVRSAVENVTLTSSDKALGEVVVIGYGSQKKKDVTGSTVTVKGETLNEIKAPNIYNQLQGRVAGVDIVSNSSNIGSTGQILIRGSRSLSGNNSPLIVVDGMAYGGSLNDLDPENIANVDVLKDASATAIYGSRGSNGVIIVTTKRGTPGRATVSYNGYVGKVNVIDTYRLFNGAEYAQFKADAAAGNSNTPGQNLYALTADETANLAKGVSTDWQDLLLTSGLRTSHDVNVRGGNDKTQYFFGLGYYKETGVIHNQILERYSFNVNIDHKVSDRVKVGFTSFNTMTRSNRTGTNAYGAATRLSPLFAPYNADGSLNFKPAIQQGADQQQINPLTSIGNNDLIRAFQRRYQFQHNVYGEVKILKDLKFRSTFGYGWSQTLNENYTGPNTVFNTNTTTAGSTLSQVNAEGWQYTINNSLEYNKTFAQKHKLQVLALQEIQKNHFQSQGFDGVGVPANFIQTFNWQLVTTINSQAGNFNESGLIGYMGRALYSYDDKYLATATIRSDESSVLAPGHQRTTYPAVSVGWNIDKERFMQNVKFVSGLKLRAGWGISSNAGIGAYTTLGSLTSNFYNFGTNNQNGYLINTAPNPELGWEKTKGTNIGLDFGLFNNRLTGSIDFYKNKTYDILLVKNLPRSLGINSQTTNVGETSSRGMEFTLSSINVKSNKRDGFVWRTDFNAAFNREKITALQNNLQQDIGNGWFVGQPLSVIFDYKKIGIWQTSEAAEAAVYGVFPGDIKIQDLNNDKAITAADRQVIGTFQPDLVAGLTNHFEYKNFDLNVVMYGRFGQTAVVTYLSADGSGAGYPFFGNSRVSQLKVNYWTPTNPTNDFPQPDAGRDGQNFTSTLTYRDGSFIKIRTIDLGYNVSGKLLSKAKIQSLRIYASAQNPFILWAPLKRDGLGIDPEGNGNNFGNAIGSQGGQAAVRANTGSITVVGMGVPPTRQLILGVNVKF
ncbi:TonB-dependent receptor [Ferruginibacter sp. HRS2-29]|uniref:SusC/RagA family TonB-linked outer membrane protein n=1 Tax=Ferruginibacter sp. HRS2-29 TaxID=2487334 RepID=UPI0020CC71CE|nr:TonB-dependent receptor [Ferruginibacter sp. HRS2-29]